MFYPASNFYKDPPKTHLIASKPQQPALPQQNPQGDTQKTLPQDTLSLSSPRNRELQVFWKREIKNYIQGWRTRNNPKWLKLFKDQLSNVLLLIGDHSITRKTNVIKQQDTIYKQKTRCLCTLSPPKKSKDLTCLIVSSHAFHGLKTEFMFELTAINQHGKIIYNAICLKSWGDLEKELAYIDKNLTVAGTLLQGKLQLMSIVPPKEFELRRFLDNLTDIDEIISHCQTSEQPSLNCVEKESSIFPKKSKFSDLKSFIVGLQLFELIKKKLYENLAMAEKLSSGVRLWEYFSLAYNVLWPMVKHNVAFFQDQDQGFLPILKKIVDKVAEKESTQPQQHSKLEHYPAYLQNAHRCWSCKDKRGYIACICCSMVEGKTVSLCLSCYGPYHNANRRWPQSEVSLPLLQKWWGIGAFADSVVGIGREVPDDPLRFDEKKQESPLI